MEILAFQVETTDGPGALFFTSLWSSEWRGL